MALDFPASPSLGQQTNMSNGVIYQWDGAKWNTRLVASYANTGANPGLTPPLNPSPGTFWWDSEAGQLYIWYVDVNSSQWMQAAVLGTTVDGDGNVVTSETLQANNLPTGTYNLSLALEHQLVVDQYGNQVIQDGD